MKKIVIIGAGNLATHLSKALYKLGFQIIQIYSKTLENAQKLAEIVNADCTDSIEKITTEADFYFFALTDSTIEHFLTKINLKNKFLIHSSGSVDIKIFENYSNNYGVIYPLQTFSKQKEVNFEEIPIFIEANSPQNLTILRTIAIKLSKNVTEMSSIKRLQLHVAAVFTNNFTNLMYLAASDIIEKNGLSFDFLKPLIMETAQKVMNQHPKDAQTGPAARNDISTIKKHLNTLYDSPNLQKLYSFASDKIFELIRKKKMINFKENLVKIRAFAFDVDGVFSNTLFLHTSGDLLRTMNTKDGFAVKYAIQQGFPMAIITGGASPSVEKRFRELGVTDIYMKSFDKLENLRDFAAKYDIPFDEILYMGDDLPDYEAMSVVGMPVCPADAVPEIRNISVYISNCSAGEGCVRDVIEQVLKVQSKWPIQ